MERGLHHASKEERERILSAAVCRYAVEMHGAEAAAPGSAGPGPGRAER